MKNTVPLLFFLAMCLGVAAVGGWITQTSVNDWYQTLIKPPMNPPDWVFTPTWIALYVMMAVAGWRVWLRPANSLHRMAMLAFAIQLILNLMWSFIFFGAKSPGFAAIEIVLLWISILITLLLFWRIDRFAGWIMCPYVLWVSFAIYLNISIFLRN
jgi:benzodiazapine receptor